MRWLVDAIHANVSRKLNLLEAVHFAIASWSDVPVHVIQNCWMKCKIVPASVMAELRQQRDYGSPVGEDDETELAQLMQNLDCTNSVEQYVTVDDNEPTNDDDEHQVEYPGEATPTEDSDEEPIVTASEALACCIQLQAFLSYCDGGAAGLEHLAPVTDLVRRQCNLRKRQSTILTFLSPSK